MSQHLHDVTTHKRIVGEKMTQVVSLLMTRAIVHDNSKFSPEEFDLFEKTTAKMKDMEYGSDEYKASLKSIKPAIDHHYAVNSHHPEHYDNGINGMDLLDVVEMVCDWMAAVQRNKNGDIYESLKINKERFNIDDQLYSILVNTVLSLEGLK